MKQHIRDEENGLTYTLHGDYYLPDIPTSEPGYVIGRWGRMHRRFLEKHHPLLLNQLILEGTLNQQLHKIDRQADVRFEALMQGYRRSWGLTEEMKENNPPEWVRLMNLARAEAEHNVIEEIVCC